MRGTFTIACAATVALCTAASLHAAEVSIGGDVGLLAPGTTSGQLQVLVDIAPENETFHNNGIYFTVSTTVSGVIEFTGAEVDNREVGGSPRLSLTGVGELTADAVKDIYAASVDRPGLDPTLPGNPIVDGGSLFLYASIDYNVVGAGDTVVNVRVADRTDPLTDLPPQWPDTFTGQSASITVNIPEPGVLSLAGMSLLGLASVRRKGRL